MSTLTKEQENALRELDAASKAMRTGAATAEKKYGLAYRKAVQLGLKPKLRGRYSV